jgi:hypothetical protein
MNPNSEIASAGAACSAGLQPAVSQVVNLRTPRSFADASMLRSVCRLQAGDTAGCKPALQKTPGSTSELSG